MDEELTQRINELARKKKTEGLTSEAQADQTRLYRIYIDELKEQLKCALDQASIEPKQ